MIEYGLAFLILLLVALAFYLVYERFVRKSSKRDVSLYVDGLKDLLDGHQESAFTKLRQVVAEDSGNLDAYLRLGRILRENSQPQRALQVHKDLTHRPDLNRADRVAILHEIADDCLAVNDYKMGEAALKELLSLDSGNHWAHLKLLRLQEQAQAWDLAFETASQILRLEGNKSKKPLAKYKFRAAEQLYRKREYHKARVMYKEALGLDPTLVGAYLAIGDSYCEERRYEDAVTFWRKLISVVPDQGHLVIERLKKTLFDLGRFGDIQEICESILRESPRNLEARRALAEFYQKKGDLDQAVQLLENVVDDYPSDISAVLELIRVYLESGDKGKVERLLRELEKKHQEHKNRPSDPSASRGPAEIRA